jgi:polygalacturonase
MKKKNVNADYVVADFGAIGGGETDDTAAFQKAIDACHAAGGGRVIVRPGETYFVTRINMVSNVELHVARGGKIQIAPLPTEIPDGLPETVQHSGVLEDIELLCGIYADNARNIAITGGGEIDGNGRAYVTEKHEQYYLFKRYRPWVLSFSGCRDVLLRDVHFVDAPRWTVVLVECEDVTVDNIKILNDMRMANCDGIDLCQCRAVRVSNCHLECADDCIVLKSQNGTGSGMPCENIVVTNCTMTSRSFAINLGCEVSAPIRNVLFNNCVITDSHRGIGVHLSRESDIENIVFSNMTIETRYFNSFWWGAAEPIYVVSIPWTDDYTVGYVRNVKFQNIICRSENGVFVYGADSAVIDGISFSDVSVELAKWSDEPGGRYDLRPIDGPNVKFTDAVFEHTTAGFTVHNAKNVTLNNCSVRFLGKLPAYFGAAQDISAAPGFKTVGLTEIHDEEKPL